jgi:hypothetical protein
LRGEALARRTEMAMGENPAMSFRYGPADDGMFDRYVLREGFYTELEVPIGSRVDVVGRWDGLRRRGNVPRTSTLRSVSAVLRYTAGFSVVLRQSLRLKVTAERYDFSDYQDETVIHTGIAGPF